jgi:hypothetical protein
MIEYGSPTYLAETLFEEFRKQRLGVLAVPVDLKTSNEGATSLSNLDVGAIPEPCQEHVAAFVDAISKVKLGNILPQHAKEFPCGDVIPVDGAFVAILNWHLDVK